jgi:hypothetical protein
MMWRKSFGLTLDGTTVESGEHLLNCLAYVDMNIVRANGRRGGDHSYLYLTDSDAPGRGMEERADRREFCVEASARRIEYPISNNE